MQRATAVLFFALIACSGESAPQTPSAGSSPGSLCPGPDEFEPNDAAETASVLALEDRSIFAAGAAGGDRDFYAFVAPRSDPLSIEAFHRPINGPVIEAVLSADGVEKVSARGAALLRLFYRPERPGEALLLRVRSTESACTPYEIEIDAAFCSDSREDDDRASNASAFAGPIEGSVIEGDDDHLSIDRVAGRCDIEVAISEDPQLTIALLDESGAILDQTPAIPGNAGFSATIAWTMGARTLRISAATSACVPYVLRCE